MLIRSMSGSYNLRTLWQDVDPQLREEQTKLRGMVREGQERRTMRQYTNYELKKLTWDLQLFADEGDAGDSGDNGASEGDAGKEGDQGDNKGSEGKDGKEGEQPRTYTDADVDAIVAKKYAKWQKQHEADLEKAKDEARKYERMSKEQREKADRKKAEEEAAKKDARIRELEAQIATDALRKTVAADVEAMKEGIAASQDFLDLVVTGDADLAKKNVDKLVGIILADRKAQEEKRATGKTPKSFGGGAGGSKDVYEAVLEKYNR